jgi:hypothetical protein
MGGVPLSSLICSPFFRGDFMARIDPVLEGFAPTAFAACFGPGGAPGAHLVTALLGSLVVSHQPLELLDNSPALTAGR